MHTKILFRPVNFHLRYQQWENTHKSKDLENLHHCYCQHVFEQEKNNIVYDENELYAKLQWNTEFNEPERLAYMIEHFKNTLLKNNYSLLKLEEKNEIWDKGLKVTVQNVVLNADAHYNEFGAFSELHFGDITLEQINIEDQFILGITCKYYINKTHYSFEKLMELLLKI